IFLEKIPMGIQVNSPIFDCYGDTVTLTANAYGGYPGYKYLWDFGGTSNIEQVVPNTSRIYRVRATDTCAIDTATAFVQVTYRSYPTLVINNIPSMFLNCPGDTLSLGPATVSGGSGDFEVSWDNWKTTVDTLMVSTDTTKHFLVKARDLCDL